MPIKDYNTDPDLNFEISGINIAEGCAPSGINNAIRQLMADVKAEKAEKDERDAEKDERDAEQDAAISSKVATVNGLTPDSNGNVDVGGMPLGTVFPYTGKDVPAGTLRADGTTYTNMQASFPDFYEWVVNSGLTVPLADYSLVEGNCGYYGLDEATGTVRMPTITNGFVGVATAGQYGQAVYAGLPNITGNVAPNRCSFYGEAYSDGAFSHQGFTDTVGAVAQDGQGVLIKFDASRSNPIYGRSDTVTPSHVKYPWVIVVYNAAVPPSVAQAGEFIELLDKLATALPTGTVVPHAGNKDLNGYLLCNGAAVSRTTYAKLFEAIGTTYGEGDGSTTFNLPNMTDGRFIRGEAISGNTYVAGVPNISGAIDCVMVGAQYSIAPGVFQDSHLGTYSQSFGDSSYPALWTNFSAANSNAIYGASNTVMPKSLSMRYYIKY